MADDEAARRREIRRRKILEGSEARLKRITGTASTKLSDKNNLDNFSEEKNTEQRRDIEFQPSKSLNTECAKHELIASDGDTLPNQRQFSTAHKDSSKFNGQFSGGDDFATNGSFSRTSFSDSYTFPKKVSDAETRSFGRTRCDARRNSTCTQMMLETFQFSSFSLTILRPWLTSFVALMLRIYFLLANTLPAFQTIYFPFVMLELAFSAWSQLESQLFTKPVDGPMISGILLLCGFSETLILKFNTIWNIVNCIIIDFAIYTFFYVFSHFICELCV